jgi:hypothetical protein
MSMEEMTKEELREGKRQLEGVLILCWVMAFLTGAAVIFGLGSIGYVGDYLVGFFNFNTAADVLRNIASFPFRVIYSLIIPALYIIELIGIYQRRAFAVPLGRAVLVVTMVLFFPIGTIVGAVLWKRFNHPLAKKVLGYEHDITPETELDYNNISNPKEDKIMNDKKIDEEKYRMAKKRVEEIKGFYGHLFSYVGVNVVLLAIDLITGDGLWFYWVSVFWGIGLFWHAMGIFVFGKFTGSSWEKRKIEEIMEGMDSKKK